MQLPEKYPLHPISIPILFLFEDGPPAPQDRVVFPPNLCAWSSADISAAKGNAFLSVASNPKFSPYDLAEFTCVQTMESRIMKFLFPEGHKTKDLTRLRDGKQLILHYIPYIEIV
jgi:hypothetical protein